MPRPPRGKPLLGRLPPVRVVTFKAHIVTTLRDGRAVFVKALGSHFRGYGDADREAAQREREVLERLEGLAVPRPVRVPRTEGLRCVEGVPCRLLVQEFISGSALGRAGLTAPELVGAWLFIAEQLAAFRRLGILYTDVKASNVLATRSPLRVTLIDLTGAIEVSADGLYRGSEITSAALYRAPEHVWTASVTERAVVHQLGMLMAACMPGADRDALRDPAQARTAVAGVLTGMKARELAGLVADCLAPTPEARPSGFGAVIAGVQAIPTHKLPPGALETWLRLRAPYAGRLEELGLRMAASARSVPTVPLENSGAPRRAVRRGRGDGQSTLFFEMLGLTRRPNGRQAVVTAMGSSLKPGLAAARRDIGRQAVCLDVLAGLAVPQRLRTPAAFRAGLLGPRRAAVLLQSHPRGRPLDRAGLDPDALLGAWLFIVEHLAAFRRQQILYTDLRCPNFIVQMRPLRLTIVNFSVATAVWPTGVYPTTEFATPAPEERITRVATERSFVHRLASLLAVAVASSANEGDARDAQPGLDAFLRTLSRTGTGDLASVIEACFAPDPKDRPENYEAVLAGAKAALGAGAVPERAARTWLAMRAPYVDRLAQVGLLLQS